MALFAVCHDSWGADLIDGFELQNHINQYNLLVYSVKLYNFNLIIVKKELLFYFNTGKAYA